MITRRDVIKRGVVAPALVAAPAMALAAAPLAAVPLAAAPGGAAPGGAAGAQGRDLARGGRRPLLEAALDAPLVPRRYEVRHDAGPDRHALLGAWCAALVASLTWSTLDDAATAALIPPEDLEELPPEVINGLSIVGPLLTVGAGLRYTF